MPALTLDQLKKIYLGEMLKNIDEFYSLQPFELMLAIQGHFERVERESMLSWEQARLIGFSSIKPHAKSSFKIHDYLTFDWENNESEEDESLTLEKMEALRQKIKDRNWEKLNGDSTKVKR